MPLCPGCDSLHVCYAFMSMGDLLNPVTGKLHKINGCDGEKYWFGEEITKENEKEYAAHIKRVKRGDGE